MIIIWCLLSILLILLILGKSSEYFCEIYRINLKKMKKMCYHYTKNRITIFTKYILTYILFYIPEKINLTLLFSMSILIKLNQIFIYFKLISALKVLSNIMAWPSEKLTNYYCNKTEPYEEIIIKMWKSPCVPFNIIFNYMEYNGRDLIG